MPEAAPITSISLDELLFIARTANNFEPGDSEDARNNRARAFVAMLSGHLPENDSARLAKAMNFPWLVEQLAPLRGEVTA